MIRIRVDLPLLFSILGLIGLGVVMVYSSSWVLSEKEFQDCWHYAERQAIFAGLAVVALSIGVWIEPHFYQKYVYLILLTTLFFLIIVLILLLVLSWQLDLEHA